MARTVAKFFDQSITPKVIALSNLKNSVDGKFLDALSKSFVRGVIKKKKTPSLVINTEDKTPPYQNSLSLRTQMKLKKLQGLVTQIFKLHDRLPLTYELMLMKPLIKW